MSSSEKGNALIHRPCASLCADDERLPFSLLVIEGSVEMRDELAHVRRLVAVIGGQHLGADRADHCATRNGVTGELAVRLHSRTIMSARDLSS